MAPMAAVSWEYIRARLNLGSAMVMIIRMIAITISNSIREKPRRRLKLSIPCLLPFMTVEGRPAWRESDVYARALAAPGDSTDISEVHTLPGPVRIAPGSRGQIAER